MCSNVFAQPCVQDTTIRIELQQNDNFGFACGAEVPLGLRFRDILAAREKTKSGNTGDDTALAVNSLTEKRGAAERRYMKSSAETDF